MHYKLTDSPRELCFGWKLVSKSDPKQGFECKVIRKEHFSPAYCIKCNFFKTDFEFLQGANQAKQKNPPQGDGQVYYEKY